MTNIQAEQERQANVIRAEGEAESADMIARAIEKAGDGLIKIRSIEASKEVQHPHRTPTLFPPPPGGMY